MLDIIFSSNISVLLTNEIALNLEGPSNEFN